MPGTLPAKRRRRLAPVPCCLRSKATNFISDSKLTEPPQGAPVEGPATRHLHETAAVLANSGRNWQRDQKLLFCSLKREVTDSPSEMRRMVSANRKATDSWRI